MKNLTLLLTIFGCCLISNIQAQQYLTDARKNLERDQTELSDFKAEASKMYQAFWDQDIRTAENMRKVLIPKMKTEVQQNIARAKMAISEFVGADQNSDIKSYVPIDDEGEFTDKPTKWQMQVYRATRQEELLKIIEPLVFTSDAKRAIDLQRGRKAVDEFIQIMQEDIMNITGGHPERKE